MTKLLHAVSLTSRLAVLLGLTLSTLGAQSVPETHRDASIATDDRVDTLGRFEVTGSRIKRADYESPSPVNVFTGDEIAAKGYVNIGDFVQSLPFNVGTANSIYQPGSFTRGAATANFRGLGSQRFLTLVDNRRVAPYAIPTSTNRSVFDFNSLPVAAIERIEVQKDGASAIYGADAVTGVINIKLKSNFSGVAATGSYGNTLQGSGGDTGTAEFSLVAGARSAATSIMTALDVKTANSNFLHDYGVTTTDYSPLGANKGVNQNSSSNWPANLTLTRAQAAAAGIAFPAGSASSWTYVINGGQPTAAPTLASFAPAPANPASPNSVLIGNENRYDFAQTFEIYPAYDYLSDYTTIEHAFSDAVKAFAEVMYSRNLTYFTYTPTSISYGFEGLTLPANNPYNPFGTSLTTLSARSNFGPTRKFDMDALDVNLVGGLRGSVAAGRWDWESAVSYGFSDVTMLYRNAILDATYQDALNGTLPGFAGKYLNPFGPSDAALTQALFTNSTNNYRASGLTWDGHVSGRLATLPTGDVGIALGAEVRDEKLQVRPDTAVYIGGGGTPPLNGKRTVSSEYAEITVPVYKAPAAGSAELQLAARHEHYSDFGDTTNPKVGAEVALPKTRWANVLLRGSYSESFQAPALAQLYALQTVGFSSALQDPLRPQDPPAVQRVVTGGNPHLLPETARVKYGGVVIDHLAGVRNLSISVDYFDFRVNQVITTPTASFLLTPLGMAEFPNAIVRDSALGNPGPIVRLDTIAANNPGAYQLYRGVDYGLRYRVTNPRAGTFSLAADATQIIKTGTDTGLGAGFVNATGRYFNPRWKASASMGWQYHDLAANVNVDWTAHYFNNNYTATGWGENPYTIVSPQISYSGWWKTTFTLGVLNVFDQRPPANGREPGGFDPNVYGAGALGRFIYARVAKRF